MRHPLLALVALSTLLPATALAGRRDNIRQQVQQEVADGPSANAGDIPALARLLERTGWAPTPELSGAFRPGFIFQETTLGHRLQVDDCFELEPTVSTYTATEVVTQLQAGVSVDLGAGEIGISGGMVKKVKFSTPEQLSLPMLKLQPTETCRTMLDGAARGGLDLGSLYVVQEVLTAQIAEQTCGRVDAQGRFVALGGAELELAMACAQDSLEPVAIAYRTVALDELLGRADAMAQPEATAAGARPASAPATTSPATTSPVTTSPVYTAAATTAPATTSPVYTAPATTSPTYTPPTYTPPTYSGVATTGAPASLSVASRPSGSGSSSSGSSGSGSSGAATSPSSSPTSISRPAAVASPSATAPGASSSGPARATSTGPASAASYAEALRIGAHIHFETGTARLTGQSKMYLDKVVTTLKGVPDLRIRIEGHTDSMGDDAVNLRLSQDRAEAVRAFLVSMGVDGSRVEAVGYGETQPIDSNGTEAGRARNRRIEFQVVTP